MLYRLMKKLTEEVSDLEKAGDPNTHPDDITKLLQHPNEDVKKAAYNNPNIKPSELLRYYYHYPTDFYKHPVTPLLDLENPNWHDRFHEDTVSGLMDIHPDFWGPKFARSDNWFKRRQVSQHPKTSPEVLHKLAFDPEWATRVEIASHPKTQPETLQHLANDEDEDVKNTAVKRLNLMSNK